MMLPLLAQAADPVVMGVPRDIPLPLPAAEGLIKFVLVVSFLAHILFVNLMVGGVTLTLVFEWMGRRRKEYDSLARAIAATVTVNKSMAVVLGVAPLLAINVLYAVWFYAANSITGRAWISVIPLVVIAFLLTYLHKYTWDRMAGRKALHMAILVPAAVLLWFIPLIFLANINLMLLPQHWDVPGFFAAVLLNNVLPRYAHFMLASLAVVSLFGVWWFGRRDRRQDEHPVLFAPAELKRKFYFIAMVTTAGQMAIGPLVYFTLPTEGMTTPMTVVIFTGAAFGIMAMLTMASEIGAEDDRIGRKFGGVVALLTVTVILMGTGRHLYRDGALAGHREQVAAKSAEWAEDSRFARARHEANAALLAAGPVGPTVFKTTCSSCHAVDRVLVGPSLQEIASLYRDKPEGIVAWTMNPGRKRTDMPQMPAFALDADVLRKVGRHMIELGTPKP
jgi:cytochrome c